VISSSAHGGRRKLPYVFTEQGVSMLSSVLNSKEAIKANVQIMRTFVSIRNLASTNKQLEKRVLEVEERSDENYKLLLTALLQLKDQIEPTLKKNRNKIGLN
jgi:two-component SAPR family response regulator